MGSAFTPVNSRRPSPMPTGGIKAKAYDGFSPGYVGSGHSRPKRTRQTSSLKQMMVLDEIDEDQQTLETVPDQVSVSASEASSKGSSNRHYIDCSMHYSSEGSDSNQGMLTGGKQTSSSINKNQKK